MDHKKSTEEKNGKSHQTEACNTGSSNDSPIWGGAIWQQKQPHTSLVSVWL
jgi:hypothetical protein